MATQPFLDYYRTLGVHRHAEPEVIQAAYRALVRRHHPDRNPGDQAAAERARQIIEAYEVLSNPAKRRDYDLKWDAYHAPRPAPGTAPPSPPPPPPRWGTYSQPATPHRPTQWAEPAPRRERRPWYQGLLGLLLIAGLCRGAGWVGNLFDDGNDAGRATRSTVVADATTVARQHPAPTRAASFGPGGQPTPTPARASATDCSGWNGWVDRMEAINTRHERVVATADADPFPVPQEYRLRANVFRDLAQDVRDSAPPPAARAYVDSLGDHLESIEAAFRAEADGAYSGGFFGQADLIFAEAERLRDQANLACAGGAASGSGGDAARAESGHVGAPTPTAVLAGGPAGVAGHLVSISAVNPTGRPLAGACFHVGIPPGGTPVCDNDPADEAPADGVIEVRVHASGYRLYPVAETKSPAGYGIVPGLKDVDLTATDSLIVTFHHFPADSVR